MSRVGNLKVIGYQFKGLRKMGVAQAPGTCCGYRSETMVQIYLGVSNFQIFCQAFSISKVQKWNMVTTVSAKISL